MKAYKNIDEYIANFPPDTQTILEKIRKTIRQIAPQAKEKISYGIPTFAFKGNLVHEIKRTFLCRCYFVNVWLIVC